MADPRAELRAELRQETGLMIDLDAKTRLASDLGRIETQTHETARRMGHYDSLAHQMLGLVDRTRTAEAERDGLRAELAAARDAVVNTRAVAADRIADRDRIAHDLIGERDAALAQLADTRRTLDEIVVMADRADPDDPIMSTTARLLSAPARRALAASHPSSSDTENSSEGTSHA